MPVEGQPWAQQPAEEVRLAGTVALSLSVARAKTTFRSSLISAELSQLFLFTRQSVLYIIFALVLRCGDVER